MNTAGGGFGAVRIPGAGGSVYEVIVAPLDFPQEVGAEMHMRSEAKREYLGAGLVERMRPVLDALPLELKVEAVREMVRLQAFGVVDEAAMKQFRISPSGLAIDLWHRGKAHTPGLTLEKLRAIITEANAPEVAAQLHEIIMLRGRPVGSEGSEGK